MIKAIIFDLFGVILSESLMKLIAEVAATDPKAADEVRSLVHAANRGIIDPEVSSTRIAALAGMTLEQYRAYTAKGEVRNDELLRYIVELRSSYKTALLTNATVPTVERRFTNEELRQYFDVCVISAEIGYAKPDPETYLITAERLGIGPGQCFFTDDREVYVQAAGEVGMRAVLFESYVQFKRDLTEVLSRM